MNIPDQWTMLRAARSRVCICLLAFGLAVLSRPVTALGDDAPTAIRRPNFISRTVTARDKVHAVDIEVDIAGAQELYLIVDEAADGIGSDWGVWLEPRLEGPNGTIRLTDLSWRDARADWGRIGINSNPAGRPIRVDGQTPAYGISAHANSVIAWNLPPGYRTFRATGALDDGGSGQSSGAASVRFAVSTLFPAEGLQIGDTVLSSKDPDFLPPSMFQVANGLKLSVWAKSPMFNNPTNIDIDAAGRVWVAEGMNYRGSLLRPEGDRIVVLEDSDGSGEADRSQVFVQEKALVSPLGLAVIDNRIVVSQPPDLIVYTDVDRNRLFDPKIDRRDLLISGFEGKNHDHSLHSVTVGPDGWWYFNTGNMAGTIKDQSGRTFRIGSLYHNRDASGQASDDGHVYIGGTAFRMRPDGRDLTPIGTNFRNSYEQAISSFGDVFQSDNDDPPACRTSWLMPFGNAGYTARAGSRKWQVDRRPGQSAGSAHWRQLDPGVMPAGDIYGAGAPTGMVFYENGRLAPLLGGMLLSCDSARNAVFAYRITPDGAGFDLQQDVLMTSNPSRNFAGVDFSRHNATGSDTRTLFRPSDIAIAPDGSLLVADWFDARVGGHNTLDLQGRGVIYRLTGGDSNTPAAIPDFESVPGLLEALASPTVHIRSVAADRLRARGRDVLPALQALAESAGPWVRARIIWLLADIGGAGALEPYWTAQDPQMRVAAFRALSRSGGDIMPAAKKLAIDASPAVRREVAVAMRDLSFDQSRDILTMLAGQLAADDRWQIEAFGTGCDGKEAQIYAWLQPRMGADPRTWSPAFARLAWRLHPPAAVTALRARALNSQLSTTERHLAMDSLAFIPVREAAEAMLSIAQAGDDELAPMASWWLHQRSNGGSWSDFPLTLPELQPLAGPTVQLAAVPTVLPPATDILALAGSVDHGRAIFQRPGACTVCHARNSTGGSSGPDLADVGGRMSAAEILDAILNPGSSIAGGYESVTVCRRNGSDLTGVLLVDSDPLVLADSAGTRRLIARRDIKRIGRTEGSIMPPAASLALTAQDVADLIAFLRRSE